MKNIVLTALVPLFLLSACTTWETPSAVSEHKKIQIVSSDFSITEQTRNVDNKLLRAVGRDYRQTGSGPVSVIVTYNPTSKVNTSFRASSELGRIVQGLRAEGVTEFNSEILPVNETADVSKALVSFEKTSLAEPDCDMMPGLENSRTELDNDYKLGCSIERHMARQIANPKDVTAGSSIGGGDARRAANVTDRYRNAEPQEDLSGETFSE